MTTFLVFSDSHRHLSDMENAIFSVPHSGIVFLGDMEEDIRTIEKIFPTERICKVTGNNDFIPDARYEKILHEDEVNLFCCHGHKYGVKQSLLPLTYRAMQCGCQVALFGHTHIQTAQTTQSGLLLLNPGSVGRKGEYAVLRLDKGKIDYTLCR